ncbi:hypothetical protein HDV02_006383 [Globomyces sp. JEL0801]|nr:hypothetical protein HDV02_006383 [Globomyces sp. JEL0801]
MEASNCSDYCQETIKKPKLEQHTYRCRFAQFTCIDCSTTFQGTDYKSHSSCVSEAQKYQGALYKGNNQKNSNIAKPLSSASLIDQINQKSGKATADKPTEKSKKEKSDDKPAKKSKDKSDEKLKKSKKAPKSEAVSDTDTEFSKRVLLQTIHSILKKKEKLSFKDLKAKISKKLAKKNIQCKDLDSQFEKLVCYSYLLNLR